MEKLHQVLTISNKPSEDPMSRRAARVLAMVHELHKAGYQGLRICCGASDRESAWQLHVFSATHSLPCGWLPADINKTARYRSQNDGTYFGWDDSSQSNARDLASKFIKRFPAIAREAAVSDWTYAGWLTSILGRAEHGQLPVFYGGLDRENDVRQSTPLPPPLEAGADLRSEVGLGASFIDTDYLSQRALPSECADTEVMSHFFGVSYPIYERGILGHDDLVSANDYVIEHGLERVSMHALRAYGYYLNRCLKWNGPWGDAAALELEYTKPMKAILSEMRKRLPISF